MSGGPGGAETSLCHVLGPRRQSETGTALLSTALCLVSLKGRREIPSSKLVVGSRGDRPCPVQSASGNTAGGDYKLENLELI